MKKSLFTIICAALLGSFASAAEKPNIILVLVDDMGWGDLSLNANCEPGGVQTPVIEMPTLSSMGTRGVNLRRHYSCAPVCAPARASMFTGRHQGHIEIVRNNSFDAALEDTHTLATVLKAAGYSTALIGKWGIGGGRESSGNPEECAAWPTRRGFDYFFGYNNHIAGHRHYPKEESNADPVYKCNAIWDGDKMITEDLDTCYCTDLFAARAKKWITDQHQAKADKPFFLALTMVAPHARLGIPSVPYPAGGGLKGGVQWLGTPGKMINTAEGEWDTFIHPAYRHNPEWERYAAARYGAQAANRIATAQRHATMITRVDQALGDIIHLCEDLGIDKNTVIVFTSDNGSHNEPGAVGGFAGHPAPAQDPSFFRSYGPFDGIKRDLWEGGLRVPCVVYAPGLAAAGTSSDFPCQFQDWMATFAELAGVPAPMSCDGVSLVPVISGKPEAQKDGIVYSEYYFGGGMAQYMDYAPNKRGRVRGEQQMIVLRAPDGRWIKGIRTNIRTGREDFEVYDLAEDTHETRNLAAEYPGIQDKLRAAVLYNRRVYDYQRDNSCGARNNGCGGSRNYDNLLVPSVTAEGTQPGLSMRQVQATPPWVPDFDTLPGAPAEGTSIADPTTVTLPAGSVTEFTGYIRIPSNGHHWRLHLTLDPVPGSRAYVRMHNFTLIDADRHYTPGQTASVSAAPNSVEAIPARTGHKGVPLAAGLHPVTIVVVQGESAPGKLRLQWNKGPKGKTSPIAPIPAAAWSH